MANRRPFNRHIVHFLVVAIATLSAWTILSGFPTSARGQRQRPASQPETSGLLQLAVSPGTYMYGGNGGHNNGDSINDGSLVLVDQTTGAVTLVGHPTGVNRLTGLAFDSTGKLFASTQGPGGFPPPPGPISTSSLLILNPATGGITSNIGTIMDGAVGISISDLSVQPGTDTLYGVRGPQDGNDGQGFLYTINKTTGAATLVGNTNAFFASIAFAPNGTLYESAADLDFMTGTLVNIIIMSINPSNGATIASVPTSQFFGALGVRSSDGVLFSGNGDFHQIFTINPTTGVATLVGDTGQNFVGDIAFAPIVAPARPWTSAGSTPAVDEDSSSKVALSNFVVGFLAGQTGTITVRYNITAATGISAFCPASQSTVRVRFRNSDNAGAVAKVSFDIHRTNISSGGNTTIFSFSSNAIGAGSAFTSVDLTPNIDFDFANNVYWIEATLLRTDPNQFTNLGSIQIW